MAPLIWTLLKLVFMREVNKPLLRSKSFFTPLPESTGSFVLILMAKKSVFLDMVYLRKYNKIQTLLYVSKYVFNYIG